DTSKKPRRVISNGKRALESSSLRSNIKDSVDCKVNGDAYSLVRTNELMVFEGERFIRDSRPEKGRSS
ncbi:hypothetical protein, partial [Turicimonas muris]|uniref:hypothetical protein n=1 Tax=Turicimonas muris TaxID=1796652 RepID=UPI0024BA2830